MARREAEKIEVSVIFKHNTDNAILVSDGDNDIWLPLSQIECDEDLSAFEPGDDIELLMPEWLAKEKGII
jgi:hypothetical protein